MQSYFGFVEHMLMASIEKLPCLFLRAAAGTYTLAPQQ